MGYASSSGRMDVGRGLDVCSKSGVVGTWEGIC